MMPALRGLEKSDSGVFLTVPATGRHEDVLVVELLDRQYGVIRSPSFQREEIDDRLAATVARCPAALRKP
jgi:hypothetical protein